MWLFLGKILILVLQNFFFFYLLCVYDCFAQMYICVPHTYLVASEVRQGHRIPWDWSYGWLCLPCGYREINPGPLQGKHVLLSAESYLWFRNFWLLIKSNINSLYRSVIPHLTIFLQSSKTCVHTDTCLWYYSSFNYNS